MVYAGLDNPDNGAASASGKRRRRTVRDIGVVLFEGFSLLTAGVIPEVFQVANEICVARSRGDVLYDVRFYSADGGNVACSSSINVWTYACDARNAIGFDALFIVGGEGAQNAARDERVVGWLREVLPLSEVVKPIGEGRLLLEAAGVVSSGQSHSPNGWPPNPAGIADDDVHEDADRYEPAKTALMLVKRDLGIDVAREAVGRLSLNGSPIVASVLSDSSTPTRAEKVRASARWLKENCGRPISVSEAVRVAAMSERNFLRCFKQEIGVTPSEFLLRTRLEMTSRLLAETDSPIDRIAKRCGWINGDRLAKIFRKRMGLTPSEYRLRTRGSVPSDVSELKGPLTT
ncbi:Transcriptional regulator GlxA family, contains an amidase domain and an AraC-type DNA-binding HTH domain [Paraburkholderia phenazinium]|uniref:Transcriptional regulator GlxA family, contains an amidase domain and an AraC-type DNA-binding HTH domain n=1 Tax=Paraburkholderia phenazinium TaxID=60549 RepID=A0A1N6G823_9BURK|nr:Transcriptional regulator GlxA family, contains an amidase domain and an AraC-type DNA-binding HTH domain [Paraburkholderia phenazinium]